MSGEGGQRMRLIWQALFVVLGWGLLYLPALGTRELQGEEARRALPGRTMLQTGDWVVPRSAGKIYNRKPPLINWAIAGAIKVAGKMNEWTVRLPSTLAVLALALTVLLAGRVWLGDAGGFLAACICLSNAGILSKGRLAEIEALYLALFGMALVVWLAAWWRQRPWLAWLGGMLLMGVGFLAKGPVHLWYFYAIVIGVLWAEGRLRELLTLRHGAGVAVFVAVLLPWALANSARNPQQDSGRVWANQVTHRLGFSEFDFVNWLLQVPQSLFNFAPWVVLLPLAWSRKVNAQLPQLGRRGQWLRGLRAGLVVGFFVIALLPSSRPRFMVPLNVAAAVLAVECFSLLAAAERGKWLRHWLAVLAGVGMLTVLAGLGAAFWYRTQVELHWTMISVSALLLVLASVWALRLRRADDKLCGAQSAGPAHRAVMGTGVLFLGVTLAPVSTLRDDLRPFANEILQHTGASPDIVLYKLDERMWPFYLGLTCREIASLDELPKSAHWIMVKEADAENRRKEMSRRYGTITEDIPIQEPVTGNAGGNGQRYRLLGFAGSAR